jgi:hypothetical protein
MFEGIAGFIWLKQIPGTMPFIRLDLRSHGNTAYLYDYYPDEVQWFIDHGWQHPHTAGYIAQDSNLGVPLYRGENHFDADWLYTIDKGEHDRAIPGGWGDNADKIAGYVATNGTYCLPSDHSGPPLRKHK